MSDAPRLPSRRAYAGWLACLAALALLSLPAAAGAHAVLERTSPERGARLERPPAQVAFHFNEPVEASFGAVRVFDARGDEVETGEPTHPDGRSDAIAVSLPPDLPDGTYTATFRVVSADSHPISGGFVFTVGEPGAARAASVSELLADAEAGPVTDAAFWLARALSYLATGLAVGLLAFLALVWGPAIARHTANGTDAWADAQRAFAARLRRALGAAIVSGLGATAAALVLQGAVAAGASVFDALDGETLNAVLATPFGEAAAARIVAWLALAAALVLLGRPGHGARRLGACLALAGCVVLVVSPALAGHAATHSPALLVAADALHVGAMCAWLGGLAALGSLLPAATRALAPAGKTRLLAATLARFSPLALAAVAALAASGLTAALAYLTSPRDLWTTSFGRAIALKALLFAALIALGALNRSRLLPRLRSLAARGDAPGAPGAVIRATLRAEAVLVACVLGVSAALVSYPPPDAAAGPVSGRLEAGSALVEYTVDPARAGANEVHLYLFDAADGSQLRARGVRLLLRLPERDVGPIEAELERAGPGHYVAPQAPLGVPGEWEAEVSFRLSRFEEVRGLFEVRIR